VTGAISKGAAISQVHKDRSISSIGGLITQIWAWIFEPFVQQI